MKKSRQPFYEEFMTKRRPKTPRCICSGKLKAALGIESPSLLMIVAGGDKGEEAKRQLDEYIKQLMKYRCYKRQLDKYQWQMFYRECRKERRKHEEL